MDNRAWQFGKVQFVAINPVMHGRKVNEIVIVNTHNLIHTRCLFTSDILTHKYEVNCYAG